jgi:hypothetical protein
MVIPSQNLLVIKDEGVTSLLLDLLKFKPDNRNTRSILLDKFSSVLNGGILTYQHTNSIIMLY